MANDRRKCLQICMIWQKPGSSKIWKLKCHFQTICHPLKKLNKTIKDSRGVGHFNQQRNREQHQTQMSRILDWCVADGDRLKDRLILLCPRKWCRMAGSIKKFWHNIRVIPVSETRWIVKSFLHEQWGPRLGVSLFALD